MKNTNRLLIVLFLATFFTYFSCHKEDETQNDNVTSAPVADDESSNYLEWVVNNMQFEVFEDNVSSFFYYNRKPTIDDLENFISGDTTIVVKRRYLDTNDAVFFQVQPYIPTSPGVAQHIFSHINSKTVEGEKATIVRFPGGYSSANGDEVAASMIEVTDNTICFQGKCININTPTDFGPPSLASLLATSINHPPARPTSEELESFPCGEVLGYYFNSRIFHLQITKNYSWYVGGIAMNRVQYINFSFDHSWYFDCPDGPLVRKMICSISIDETYFANGIQSSTSFYRTIYTHHFS